MSGKTPLEHAIVQGGFVPADASTIHELRRVCSTCDKTQGQIKGKMLKCGDCQQAYYCSSECQRIDWPKHKGECAEMKSAARG
jgi:hypothetical protein